MRHPNQVCPNAIEDARKVIERQRRAYGNRGVENHGANFTAITEHHGLDLPPALNRMYCRDCREEVIGRATCPKCESRAVMVGTGGETPSQTIAAHLTRTAAAG